MAINTFAAIVVLIMQLRILPFSHANTYVPGEKGVFNPYVLQRLEAHLLQEGKGHVSGKHLNDSLALDVSPKQKLARMIGLRPNDSNNENKSLHILMLGDSTTRNQLLLLCDLLEDKPREFTLAQRAFSGYEQRACKGTAYGIKNVSITWIGKTTQYPDLNHIINAMAADDKHNNTIHVTYYASAALHILQLLPLRDFNAERAAGIFVPSIQAALRGIREMNSCPIFMTMHYVCQERFTYQYASIANAANFIESNKEHCSAAVIHTQ